MRNQLPEDWKQRRPVSRVKQGKGERQVLEVIKSIPESELPTNKKIQSLVYDRYGNPKNTTRAQITALAKKHMLCVEIREGKTLYYVVDYDAPEPKKKK